MDLTPSYQALASEILQHCPAGFASAKLSGSIDDGDVATVQLTYETLDGTLERPRVRGVHAFNISNSLFDLQKKMQRPGEQPWTRFIFTLHGDGKFKFDVEYDD